MPIYEYACKDCQHHFDVRHSADEKPELSCPKCGGEVRKVFHPAGVIFKGSGWHVTDYAPKKSSLDNGESAVEKKDDKPATPSTT